MEILNISLLGTVVVNQPVSPVNCSDEQVTRSLPLSLEGSPFTISARYNSLAVIGCRNSVWLVANNKTTIVGGCTAMCENRSTWESSCNGVNCCRITIPPRLKELQYTYKTVGASSSNNSCGYVFAVEKRWLETDYISYKPLDRYMPMSNPTDQGIRVAPLVLEWEFGKLRGDSDRVCTYSDDDCLSFPDDLGRRNPSSSEACFRRRLRDVCSLYPTSYVCKLPYDRAEYYFSSSAIENNYYDGYDYVSSIKYCSCPQGYEGNPYLQEGCIDIDECRNNKTKNLCGSWACTNVKGDYRCEDRNAQFKARLKIAFISIGSWIGAIVLLLIAWKSAKGIERRIEAIRRRKFFKRNGGLLLERQLSATDNGLDRNKLFGSEELALATDHYNENRILGRGGQGTVYKGMLKDGTIVAVKKSKRVEEGDLQVFINEVVILSQVNHRNVVKLLGCSLETEVPLLVYEFIPNGTVYQHIHGPCEEFSLTWEMRVRIAREVAGALAYLHSAASTPIYHRDIKSTNILLDGKYRAKISDFGTSRSIAIDQTHLTTRVQGTFGYFDPEYFRSSRFTDKSDVYSFGVVVVELLTGEKAVSSSRVEQGRNLAMHFLDSMEENQLFEILDSRIVEEGKRDEIMAVAHLASKCLHLNGKTRPTMKEVAAELEGLKKLEECSNVVQNRDENRELSCASGSTHSGSITLYSSETESAAPITTFAMVIS